MNWPIDTLTIRRFRGLTDVTLSGLGGVNLLVGDNNSGKTSVLEGISIYASPMDPFAWRTAARRRVRGFRTISTVEGVKWLFPHDARTPEEGGELFSGEIAIDGTGRGGTRVLVVRGQEIEEIFEPRQFDPPRQLDLLPRTDDQGGTEPFLVRGINLAVQLGMEEHVAKHEMQFRDYGRHVGRDRSPEKGTALNVELISPFDHGLEELYTGQFRRAVIHDHKDQVIAALQRIDPGIQDMEFLPDPNPARFAVGALYLRHARSGRTPLSAFGDGVRRVLLMALTMVSASGGVLLVDEIETAIHISVLGDVFKWIVDSCRRYDVQLFATTHSLEALDAILTASSDELVNIVGHRFPSPERGGPAKRYEGDQLSRLRFNRGLDVR